MSTKKRRNGEGSVSYDEDRGTYRVWVTSPNGKRVSKRFSSEEEALTWKNQQLHSMDQGIFVQPSKITLGQWGIEWLSQKKQSVSLGTYENYVYISGHLDLIAQYKLQEIQPLQIYQLYRHLSKSLSGCTIHKVHKLLKASLGKAVSLNLTPKNIMFDIDTPKFEKKDIIIFSREDIEKILQTCHDHCVLKKKYPMILLAATTGIRLGKLLGLRWCDVLFPTNEIFIRKSLKASKTEGLYLGSLKTKSSIRKIRITEDMMKIFRSLRADVKNMDINQEMFCFPARTGNPISLRNMERAWDDIIRNAKVPYKNIHVLRHTHATELLAAGVPIIEVSRRLGHSKVSHTLELYGHAIPNYDDKIADKVTQFYVVPQ